MTPKDFITEHVQTINNLSKEAGYKINTNKSVVFLYSKGKQAEKDIRELSPFTIVTNNIKYLDVTQTKQLKDLYDKNFKSLKKKMKISEDGKISHARGLAGLIYTKRMAILSKAI